MTREAVPADVRLAGAGALALVGLVLGGALAEQGPEGWAQLAGGPGRSGVAELPEGTLDVVASYNFLPLDWGVNTIPPGLVLGPEGPATFAMRFDPTGQPESCAVFVLDDVEAGRARMLSDPVPCADGGRMLAYDAPRDAFLVCVDGLPSSPLLQAWDAQSGAVRWTVAPAVGGVDLVGARDLNDWFCGAPALLDDGDAIVPFTNDAGRHRIQRIRLDGQGQTVWAASVSARTFAGYGEEALPSDQAFYPYIVTATPHGVVAVGLFGPTNAPFASGVFESHAAVAWIAADGRVVAGASTSTSGTSFDDGRTGRVGANGGSQWAAASGTRAATILGDELFVVDPLNREPVRLPLPALASDGTLAPTAWVDETLVAPLGAQVAFVDLADPEQTQLWTGVDGSLVTAVVLAPPSDAWFAVVRATAEGVVSEVVRVDLAEARTLQRVPLPEDVEARRLLPFAGGLLAYDRDGDAAVLAAATAPRPAVALSTAFPPVDGSVTATVTAGTAGAAARLFVAWGDGVVAEAAFDEPLRHVYDEGGLRTIRATVVYEDGRTATSEASVHVGGTPPQELNFMQRAFAPENQETTYAVGGLALTLLGAAVATVEKKRRRGRVGQEIRALHRIRERANDDLPGALRELNAFHVRIERDHATGKLDDGQFGALELREARLRDALRNRVLGPVAGRVTPRFLRALDHAFEDGRIEPQEAAALRAALGDEANLSRDERERLAALFDAWSAGEGTP